jgi:periplasmic copper chaperone A
MRQGTPAFYSEAAMVRMCKLRKIELGAAVVLTMAALLFVAWAVWAAEPGGIVVEEGWARPTIGEGRMTAAYMTIANSGAEDDVLKGARSPKAKAVELHQTTMTDDGVMQMRPVEDGLPIAAGKTLTLSPGGDHLMIMGLDEALAEGGELPLTLDFATAGAVDITVPVSASPPKGPSADEGGHAHH